MPATLLATHAQMWRFEGSRTLAHYLRRRDSLRALAADMDVPVEAVPAVVMKQLFQGLAVRAARAGYAAHQLGWLRRSSKGLVWPERRTQGGVATCLSVQSWT